MKVEFAVLWDDHTWTTEVHDVPTERWRRDIEFKTVKWANDNLQVLAKYRRAVLFAIYCMPFPD